LIRARVLGWQGKCLGSESGPPDRPTAQYDRFVQISQGQKGNQAPPIPRSRLPSRDGTCGRRGHKSGAFMASFPAPWRCTAAGRDRAPRAEMFQAPSPVSGCCTDDSYTFRDFGAPEADVSESGMVAKCERCVETRSTPSKLPKCFMSV
jgi:hypothetical protein